MSFPNIIGDLERTETIAAGPSVRDRHRLASEYGGQPRMWRKMKGLATVELPDGTLMRAEVHWYEAHGIGKKEHKVKNLLYPIA